MLETMEYVFIAVAVVVFVVANILLLICCLCISKRKRKRLEDYEVRKRKQNEYSAMTVPVGPKTKKLSSSGKPEKVTGRADRSESVMELAMKNALEKMARSITIESDRLTVGDPIGQGHYGVVCKGQLRSRVGSKMDTVAIKTVLPGTDVDDMSDFLQEALRMKNFTHEHVLGIIGLVERDGRPFVVIPFMEHGDLRNYLQDTTRQFTVMDLMNLAIQVVYGMVYLAERKFVHRDLAARNCMVTGNGLLKVADFGLSCDLFDDDYYRVQTADRPLPIKWMAVESFTMKIFTEKTDVWSFGVLLWEVLTRGQSPYENKTQQEIISYVKQGGRLARPQFCPDEIYDLMKICWDAKSHSRPTFQDLSLKMSLMIYNEEGGKKNVKAGNRKNSKADAAMNKKINVSYVNI